MTPADANRARKLFASIDPKADKSIADFLRVPVEQVRELRRAGR